jgi:hypothetical protein
MGFPTNSSRLRGFKPGLHPLPKSLGHKGRVVCLSDASIHQDGIGTHLHRLSRVRWDTKPGIHHHGNGGLLNDYPYLFSGVDSLS